MSRKRVKQYLMLLIVIGVVAIAASGGGTFASFNAQVTNPNNTFANGTLLLHNTHGATTCTSESNSTNVNPGTGTSGDTCATLFSGVNLTPNATTLTGNATVGTSTSVSLTTVALPDIQVGDTLTLSDGTDTDTVTTTSVGAAGSTVSVNITWDSITNNGHVYLTTNTVVQRSTVTAYASLTLKNAGTVDASQVQYSGGSCATHGTGSTATITGATTGTYDIPVSSLPTAIRSGQEVGVTHNGTTTYVHASADAAVSAGATTVSVTENPGTTANADTLVYGPELGTPANVCTSLQFVIIETDATFGHDSGDKALGCAAGALDPSNATNGVGCDFAASPNLTSISSLTDLVLKSGGSSNTGTHLDGGGSRYLLIGVKLPTVASINDYQGRTATFGLDWKIIQ